MAEFRHILRFAIRFLGIFFVCAVAEFAWAAPAETASSSEGSGGFVMSYLLVLLVVCGSLLVALQSSFRSDELPFERDRDVV